VTGFSKLFYLALLFIGLFSVETSFAVSDSANVNLQVTGVCNNNGTCEATRGETSSNCSADCTTEPSPTQTTGTGGNPLGLAVFIKDIEINPGFNSAEISWKTTKLAACSFYWGETSEYGKEIISETGLKASHLVKLNSLLSGSYYHFKIICLDSLNLKGESQDKYFQTLSVLSNVKNFTALGGDKKIILNWENPTEASFFQVRLVRNSEFYPLNINDGAIIYEGSSSFFLDSNLNNGKRYYYAIFAEYVGKNYSSGALTSAIPQGETAVANEPSETIPAKNATSAPLQAEETKQVKFIDFDFYSGGEKLAVKNNKRVEIENNKNLLISIDSEKLPKNLKTIIAELSFGGKKYSYLFESSTEKTIYNVMVVSPDASGANAVKFALLDDKNQKIQEIEGELRVSKKQEIAQICYSWFGAQWFANIILWLILLILIVILWLLFRRRKEKNNFK